MGSFKADFLCRNLFLHVYALSVGTGCAQLAGSLRGSVAVSMGSQVLLVCVVQLEMTFLRLQGQGE